MIELSGPGRGSFPPSAGADASHAHEPPERVDRNVRWRNASQQNSVAVVQPEIVRAVVGELTGSPDEKSRVVESGRANGAIWHCQRTGLVEGVYGQYRCAAEDPLAIHSRNRSLNVQHVASQKRGHGPGVVECNAARSVGILGIDPLVHFAGCGGHDQARYLDGLTLDARLRGLQAGGRDSPRELDRRPGASLQVGGVYVANGVQSQRWPEPALGGIIHGFGKPVTTVFFQALLREVVAGSWYATNGIPSEFTHTEQW